jgi:predicted DNA-binding transcriptional regulator YafY
MVTHSAEVAAFCDRSLELRDGRFIAQHGADFEVTDLAESRELIVDDIGTMVLSPDLLLEMGGAGRYEVEEAGDGRLVLVSTEENESLLVGGKTLASSCPACFHDYEDSEEQRCPDCGSSRPMV